MKKWILIIIVLLIIIMGFAVSLYLYGHKPYSKAEKTAVETAENSAGIKEVEQFYLYNGSSTCYTVVGKDADGTKKAVFIPENKKDDLVEVNWADGISKKEALNKLKEEKTPRKILGIRLGLEDVGPVWEITYLDDEKDLNYFYIVFKSGEWWKKIENI
ncbi:DUF5590 domain-containing protein [Falsibacillus pallidus]|uniref:cell wall elongation regulator TseB-like domain-containing protein n=1 Tax=Falsibacillus pallidus TaxID=493781 RepID=UPI003D989F5D